VKKNSVIFDSAVIVGAAQVLSQGAFLTQTMSEIHYIDVDEVQTAVAHRQTTIDLDVEALGCVEGPILGHRSPPRRGR
jgi:hypothetical protein